MEDDFIRVARSEHGPVFGPSGNPTCYGCGGAMHWCKAHKRNKNGIAWPVIGHFRHNGDGCGGEGAMHKAAKHAASVKRFQFYKTCPRCHLHFNIEIPDGTYKEEVPFKVGDRQYYLDVGILDNDGRVVGAIEVYNTHMCEPIKYADMTGAGLAWVEVDCDKMMNPEKLVEVLTCAQDLCTSCEQVLAKEMEEELATEERRVQVAHARRVSEAIREHNQLMRAKAIGCKKRELWDNARAEIAHRFAQHRASHELAEVTAGETLSIQPPAQCFKFTA